MFGRVIEDPAPNATKAAKKPKRGVWMAGFPGQVVESPGTSLAATIQGTVADYTGYGRISFSTFPPVRFRTCSSGDRPEMNLNDNELLF